LVLNVKPNHSERASACGHANRNGASASLMLHIPRMDLMSRTLHVVFAFGQMHALDPAPRPFSIKNTECCRTSYEYQNDLLQ